MTPYYEDAVAGITIYHGDCREILPTLDAASVDLVLTDPPYGLGELWQGGGGTAKTSWRFNPNEAKAWDGDTVDAVLDLPRFGSCVIWGGNYYPLPPSRSWFLWDKKQNDKWTTGQAEMAWTNLNRPVRVFRMAQCEAHGEMNREMRRKAHPTQKPLSLMMWCIRMARMKSGLILDPFAGSGTSLVAAKSLGIRAIGIEIEERYCEIAARRLQQAVLPLAVGG